ncbi:MAG: hypothetical protein EA371_02625 [Gammaproteobacteria bacterium]|nr:MAG: hypothetical protein EA371_02625 [Gammaproteobacteria bacterium]
MLASPRQTPAVLAAALIAVALCTVPAALADDGAAHAWLERMHRAVEELNYEGVFVHVHGGRAESHYVVHRYMDGRVSERIVSLDGAGREIVRHEDEVTCILPDQRTVLVEGRRELSPLVSALPASADALGVHYELLLQGQTRIAERPTEILIIQPLDGYRYGYKLWLDQDTAMPLKTQLRDETGEVVEQILFTSISLPEYIPASAMAPVTPTEGFTWLRRGSAEGHDGQRVEWRAARLPAGFRLTSAAVSMMADSSYPVQHLVYSDGLAAVSVFIEDPQAEGDWTLGLARVGGANAFSLRHDGRVVTAIGEVPARTVEAIARSLEAGDPHEAPDGGH